MVHEHLAYQSFEGASSNKKLLRTKASLQQEQQRQQPQQLQQHNPNLLRFKLKQKPEQHVEQPSLHVPQATLALGLTLEAQGASQPPSSCTLNKARMATRQRQPHTTVRAIPPLYNLHIQQCNMRGPALPAASKAPMRLASRPKIFPMFMDAQSH